MHAKPVPNRMMLVLAYIGFVSLGLPDTVVGVAWPSVRETFNVSQSSLGWLFVMGGCGYLLSSFFSGKLRGGLGIGLLLATSSALVAVSAFTFALAPMWLVFIAAALGHGLGSGAIDSGLNHWAAHHVSARHMNWLHASYSIGAMLGPLIMTAVIANFPSWRIGYATVATIMVFMTALFFATHRRWDDASPDPVPEHAGTPHGMLATLGHGLVWLQVVTFFVYTGLEITVGQWSFTLLTESRGIGTEFAGLAVTGYWASIAAGRLVFGAIVHRTGIDRLVRCAMLAGILGGVLLAVRNSAAVNAVGLALIGFAIAPIFPCLMTRTPQRLGPALAAHAVGFQVGAAMLGVAALPSITGWFAQRNLEAVAYSTISQASVLFLLHEILVRRTAPEPHVGN